MSWFKKGLDAQKALEMAEKVSLLLKERAVPKFWLKPNEEAHVIFVDDEGFWVERHVVRFGNGFIEFTCRAGVEPCPLCLREERRPIGMTYFTVIDLRQYEKKDGTIAKYVKKLLPARRTLAKQIFDYKQRFGSLVGLRAILKRYTTQDPSCGIIVDFVRNERGQPKKYSLASLGKDYTVPYDYMKVLAPPTDEELKAFGYNVAIVGDIPIPDDLSSEEKLLPEDLQEEPINEQISKEAEELPEEEVSLSDEVELPEELDFSDFSLGEELNFEDLAKEIEEEAKLRMDKE